MGVLEYLVIAAILIAAVYVGYHVWESSMNSPAEHESINPVELYSFEKQVNTKSAFIFIKSII